MAKKLVREGIESLFTDKGNAAALSSWSDMYDKRPKNDYTIVVNEPFIIETDNDDDIANLKYILNKYRIKFDYDEKRKK